jgi:hypothetical protein
LRVRAAIYKNDGLPNADTHGHHIRKRLFLGMNAEVAPAKSCARGEPLAVNSTAHAKDQDTQRKRNRAPPSDELCCKVRAIARRLLAVLVELRLPLCDQPALRRR